MFKSKSLKFGSDLPEFAHRLNFVKTKGNTKLPSSAGDGYAELEYTSIFDAQMVTSQLASDVKQDIHYPILDFDFKVDVVKSSSGNSHVYINKPLRKEDMDLLVDTLVNVGLLQEGVGNSWIRNGFLTLRLPWVKKGEDKSYVQQQDPSLEQPKEFVPKHTAPVQPKLQPHVEVKFTLDEDKGVYFNKEYGLMFNADKVNLLW